MLIRFTVENFLSFNDRISFSMLPTSKERRFNSHKTNKIKGISVLKAAIIFGANASGKSNLIKAIAFGQKLVLRGRTENEIIDKDDQMFKLFSKTNKKTTSRMEYEIQHKNKNYAYGFVFDAKEIKEEWLYEIKKNAEDIKIFERKNTSEFDVEFLRNSNESKSSFLDFLVESTRKNQLFIKHVGQLNTHKLNIKAIDDVTDWFDNALTIIYPHTKRTGIKFELSKNETLAHLMGSILNYFDTGITGVEFQEINFSDLEKQFPSEILQDIKDTLLKENSEKRNAFLANASEEKYYSITKKDQELKASVLKTKHTNPDGEVVYFDLMNESDGTRRLFDLIPFMLDFMKGDDNVMLVDEIERSLHPNLVYELFNLLLNNEQFQGKKNQMIATTHEDNLFNEKLLRQDEIWFVQKDRKGASHLQALSDYKGKLTRENYLRGRYKGIPRIIGDIELDD